MNTENLNLKPVRFTHTGSSGNTMGKGTDYYLSKLIAQNIAYAAYHRPKTITEIAEALGAPAAFIEDEIASLEDNGFLDKMPGGKYQTNIYIEHLDKEVMERKHELFKRYVKPVCEQYIPLVLESVKEHKSMGLYTPKDDINFLIWTLISYACKHKFYFKPGPYDSKYRVKRKDGGDYIATAAIIDEDTANLSFDPLVYQAPNNMTRWGDYPVHSWQLTTYYDTRTNDYGDNRYEDYCWLYDVMAGKTAKDPANADKFKRLYDKGYLVTDGDNDYVNMVVSCKSQDDLIAALPAPPDSLKQAADELDQAMFALEKDRFPPHMQELCRLWNSNCLSAQDFVAYVLAQLIDDGVLKPLTDVRKASVNTIMFCDMLP